MAVVAEMVAVAVAKVLINYYLQEHLETRKPSSLLAYRTKSVCENPYDTSKYLVL